MAQITGPYGISDDEAGYISAGLVVAGIVGAVVMGIFLDKTKRYLLVLRTFVPVLGFMYLAFLLVGKFWHNKRRSNDLSHGPLFSQKGQLCTNYGDCCRAGLLYFFFASCSTGLKRGM